MKKIGILFALMLLTMSMAFAVESDTYISGNVYSGADINSPVVVGADVHVTCNAVSEHGVTDGTGKYEVLFIENSCPLGSSVQACVGSVCNAGTVDDVLETQFNITGVDIFNVPEFSVITAMVALMGATAMFVVIRKRN